MLDRLVLAENQIVLVTDPRGDIPLQNSEGLGLYWGDTRFLSLLDVAINGTKPTLLSSAGEYNFMNTLQFDNPHIVTDDNREVHRRTISIRRNRFLFDGLYERVGFFNYNDFAVELRVAITVGSDFRDMFDVRSYALRATHGEIEDPVVSGRTIQLRYLGQDRVRRCTEVQFTPAPRKVQVEDLGLPNRIGPRVLPGLSGRSDSRTEYAVRPPFAVAQFDVRLPPKQSSSITLQVVPEIASVRPSRRPGSLTLDAQFVAVRESYQDWERISTHFETDQDVLNAVLRRAGYDLRLLSHVAEDGYVPAAGIPWFAVPFGRDSLITSLQTLAFQPRIAYGSLRFLADHQGAVVDPWRQEEPGKILHEARTGEVARLGLVPHTAYYGSVDATPLFLLAAAALHAWSGDGEFIRRIGPNLRKALEWLDRYGDLDGDGYLEYQRRSAADLGHQGWRDSFDAVTWRDKAPVEYPVALAEVQGYVYAARIAMAELFRALGDDGLAGEQERRAADLKSRFERDFWLEEEQFYAMALDGRKRPVPAVSSTIGQCLWTGLIDGPRSAIVAERLLREDLDAGWGVRTLSEREPMFNPMSYHNGSVWPHDNAFIAAGLKRLGLDIQANRLIEEVLEAAMRFPLQRLPEFYCGFTRDRRYFSLPAPYPTSCSPQAWSAGAVFLMMQTLLGLRVDAARRQLHLRPLLPAWLNRVSVRRMRVGTGQVEFTVWREDHRTRFDIVDDGGFEFVVSEAAGTRTDDAR